ncbi:MULTISPECIES: Card1-like endonuclease domain-containing protein [Acinetobacter]|uniref:Card1-like endonuclease domain-containing protein n=2 Tax=Moraxellaceae TaxID=468 RepID=UPI0005C6782C|nr:MULTISPECIES: DUF1887 family CARF protein [Acinetobacter]
MRILVLSTTGQPEANLESARYFMDNNSHIEKITILSTDYMDKEGKTELLKKSLNSITQAEIEILNIPNGYEESNMFAMQELILNWVNSHPLKDTFMFNVTGGTKIMSIVLDRAAMLLGTKRAECFYQSRDHHITWYQRQDHMISFPINSNLGLQQRVLARGYQVTKQQPIQEVEIIELKYGEFLIDKMRDDFSKGRKFISFMNKLACLAEEDKNLTAQYKSMETETIEEISNLAQITQNHFFGFNSDTLTIEFKSKETIAYVKGGWLEIYAGYECFKVLISLTPQAELALNVELKKNQTPNEMDIMFIHHANLYCIECKTAKTMAEDKAQDVLYKLSALQDFGGLNQKRAVVSLYSLKDYNLTRAYNSDIKIFQEKELLNLSEHILKWLQPNQKEQVINISL